ncbi:MAG TPA: fibronectin type III domain-containing protein [Thermoanaerobaculia bacterium]|nr:fibronectin type III domain-containing protein [Thermoanaerobaculia bacterium]
MHVCRTQLGRGLFIFLLLAATSLQAQLTVYDDALQNGYLDYSYGGGDDFVNPAPVHSGTYSIAFTGNNFNALSFARPAPDVSSGDYGTIRFWVHGGAAGGQQLRIYLQLDDVVVVSGELDSYIDGGAIVAGTWTEVTVDLAEGPLAYAGSFDRIDLQSDAGGAQPVLYIDDIVLQPDTPDPVATMEIEQSVTVASMLSDRFTWRDSNGEPRVAVLAHNNVGAGPGGTRGGAMREFRYQLPNGATRIASVTTYGNAGYGGFGYVVSHASDLTGCSNDSPLGEGIAGTFERIFEGRHHAIFRFRQNYPRNCSSPPDIARKMPITIDWMFSTGHDHPLWTITWHVDETFATADNTIAPVNTLFDDARAPYGEFNIDGDGFTAIDGVAWGDRYKFTSTTAPVTLNSAWTWNVANSVPYVKLWLNAPLAAGNKKDATMGLVQTQTMTQQDAGGGRNPNYHDLTPLWGTTSADGPGSDNYLMPWQGEWPYQANAFNLGPATSSNNARLTWGTQWGFLGQSSYVVNDGVVANAPGYPKKSYSTYVVMGTHSSSPVEAQVEQVETIQTLTLSATTGSVVTSGPAGAERADTVTYDPPGYNHVYGALAFEADGNALAANIAVGAGTLANPLLILGNYTGGDPVVTLGGITLVADADYFASLRAPASELWLTLNRDLTGAVNALTIAGEAPPDAPPIPAGLIAAATTTTQVDLNWTASAGADSYEIDRRGPGEAFALLGTSVANSYSDPTAIAGTSYLYQVRAVNGAGTSGNSTPDLATTVIFTDTLVTGLKVKAVHLSQLRTAANAVRLLADLGAAAFTDVPGPTIRIKILHVTELRTAINAARTALGLTTPAFTDATLTGVKVKRVHFQEMRDRVH